METENKYKNGKIYTIRSYQTDKFYIGSTIQKYLSKRINEHKRENHYVSSQDILKYDDAYIELLELYPCNSKEELRKREGELIRLNKNNVVNCRIEARTYKEWQEDNREKVRKLNNEFYKKNNEEIQKKRQEKILCDCGVVYPKNHKSEHFKSKKHINNT
jgi:hypothetical protein